MMQTSALSAVCDARDAGAIVDCATNVTRDVSISDARREYKSTMQLVCLRSEENGDVRQVIGINV